MITLLAASAILTSIVFPATSLSSNPNLPASYSTAVSIQWSDVSDYIAKNAISRDLIAETYLRAEAQAGIKTWVLTFAASGSVEANRTGAAKFDGPGLGWPAAGRMIRFSNSVQASQAAAMVDQVTASYKPNLVRP